MSVDEKEEPILMFRDDGDERSNMSRINPRNDVIKQHLLALSKFTESEILAAQDGMDVDENPRANVPPAVTDEYSSDSDNDREDSSDSDSSDDDKPLAQISQTLASSSTQNN